MLPVALDRDDIDGVRLVGVNVDRETEVGRQVAADLPPGLAGVVAAHDVPVLLHEQDIGRERVHGDVMNAVSDFGAWSGMHSERSPRLIGCHVLPPSSVRNAPAAEMAT